MQHVGLHTIPLPHRFSLWGYDPNHPEVAEIKAQNRPFTEATAPIFPFPDPTVIGINIPEGGGPPQLKFNPLTRALTTTNESSRTSIVNTVHDYNNNVRLHRVRISNQLWTDLICFALGPDAEFEGPLGINFPADHLQGEFNTFRQEALQTHPVPSFEEQKKPLYNLWGWFLMQLNTRRSIVNSELSVQDEIHRQLLYPMNQIMEVFGFSTSIFTFGADLNIFRFDMVQWKW